jgi:hypothetical protein
MQIDSRDLETEGTWLVLTGGLVRHWLPANPFLRLRTYFPAENDVLFWYGPLYNMSKTSKEIDDFLSLYHIRKMFEIVEVFREPWGDVDGGFKGRTFLVTQFDNAEDAAFFRETVASSPAHKSRR